MAAVFQNRVDALFRYAFSSHTSKKHPPKSLFLNFTSALKRVSPKSRFIYSVCCIFSMEQQKNTPIICRKYNCNTKRKPTKYKERHNTKVLICTYCGQKCLSATEVSNNRQYNYMCFQAQVFLLTPPAAILSANSCWISLSFCVLISHVLKTNQLSLKDADPLFTEKLL